MTKQKTAAIVLAAGLGTRMESRKAKVLHPIAGRPMIGHVMEMLQDFGPERVVTVIGREAAGVAEAVSPHPCVVQEPRLGTAHAVLAAREALGGFDGSVFIVFGDTPLVSITTLEAMAAAREANPAPAVVVLGFRPDDPSPYGRLVLGAGGDRSRPSSRPATRRRNSCRSDCAIQA